MHIFSRFRTTRCRRNLLVVMAGTSPGMTEYGAISKTNRQGGVRIEHHMTQVTAVTIPPLTRRRRHGLLPAMCTVVRPARLWWRRP